MPRSHYTSGKNGPRRGKKRYEGRVPPLAPRGNGARAEGQPGSASSKRKGDHMTASIDQSFLGHRPVTHSSLPRARFHTLKLPPIHPITPPQLPAPSHRCVNRRRCRSQVPLRTRPREHEGPLPSLDTPLGCVTATSSCNAPNGNFATSSSPTASAYVQQQRKPAPHFQMAREMWPSWFSSCFVVDAAATSAFRGGHLQIFKARRRVEGEGFSRRRVEGEGRFKARRRVEVMLGLVTPPGHSRPSATNAPSASSRPSPPVPFHLLVFQKAAPDNHSPHPPPPPVNPSSLSRLLPHDHPPPPHRTPPQHSSLPRPIASCRLLFSPITCPRMLPLRLGSTKNAIDPSGHVRTSPVVLTYSLTTSVTSPLHDAA
ncbi:hypothetical protein C7M84_021893 [Penaeus vannamei]|uniref:Uncharacterized protein n=1 Tax=Penaeus vannamei TaxID=6689 RepID=A0A3R7T127_PENVA|nr:hypothetical protein C7M84_021893 [Penaeus vannamei]